MRDRLSDYQEAYGELFNLEATPAESTAYVWPNTTGSAGRISAPREERGILLTTPTAPICRWIIPPTFLTPWISRMSFRLCILPVPCSTRFWRKASGLEGGAALVRKIAENYRLPYYTLSPTYSVCRGSWIYRGRAFHLSHLREEGGGLQQNHRLLPPGAELERWESAGV